MSTAYVPILKSILTSSVWGEAPYVRVVWMTMIVLSDADGKVEGSVPGLARLAVVSREECEDALTRLSSEDPDSRSKELDGRRIVKVDGGWQLVNHHKIKEDIQAAAEKNRERQRRFRSKKDSEQSSKDVEDTSECNADVTPCNVSNADVTLHNVTPFGLGLDLDLGLSSSRSDLRSGSDAHARDVDIQCPTDLCLTPEQRSVLETAMIPAWAIDALTVDFVASQVTGSKPRPMSAWLKCLSKSINSAWNNPKRRPKKPEIEGATATPVPERLEFTEAHRGLATRGSIDINLSWREFKCFCKSRGVTSVNWSAAFESELAKSIGRIERAAQYRATERNAQRDAATAPPTRPKGSGSTDAAPLPPKALPVADAAKSERLRNAIARIG